MQLGQTIATYCRTCGRVTQSEAVGVKYSLWQEPANEHIVFDHEIEHDLLLCSECQTAQIRSAMRTEQLSEEWREAYVPPHPVRELPHWVSSLPNDVGHIRGLLEEVRGGPANLNTAISGNSAQTQTGLGPGKKQEDHEQKTPPQSLSDLQGQGGR